MANIENIEVFSIAMPLRGVYRNAYSTRDVLRSAVVRITTVDGVQGIGNIDPVPGYSENSIDEHLGALRGRLAPLVRGCDARNVNAIVSRMDSEINGFLDAKAAVEMACVEIAARMAGVPVHVYLGGAIKERLTFNAWIGTVPPDVAAEDAARWRANGFRSAKVKIGHDAAEDCARVHAVREAVGNDFAIRVDANASLDADAAIALLGQLAPMGLQLLEQPTAAHDLESMAKVRQAAGAYGIRIMADESLTDHASLINIIKADAADLVKIKIAKQGGIVAARRMLATAEAAGLSCVVGSGFGLGITTLAEIMLASTSAAVIDGLECVGPLKTADDVVAEKLDLSRGAIDLPSGVGWGADIDETKLHRYSHS